MSKRPKIRSAKVLILLLCVFVVELFYMNYVKSQTDKSYEIFHQLQALKRTYRETELIFEKKNYNQSFDAIVKEIKKRNTIVDELPSYVQKNLKNKEGDFNTLYVKLRHDMNISQKYIERYKSWSSLKANSIRILYELNEQIKLRIKHLSAGQKKNALAKMVKDISSLVTLIDYNGISDVKDFQMKLKDFYEAVQFDKRLKHLAYFQDKHMSVLLNGYNKMLSLHHKHSQLKLDQTIDALHEVFYKVLTKQDERNAFDAYILNAFIIVLFLFLYFVQREENHLHQKVSQLNKNLEDNIDTLESVNKQREDLIEKFDKNVIASKTDVNGIITYASQAFCRVSKYSQEELMGEPHNIVRHPNVPLELYRTLWETVSSGREWHGELENRAKDGSSYWVDIVISPEFDSLGNITGYSAIRQDITAKKELEVLSRSLEEQVFTRTQELEALVEKVETLSITDELTQLYNRRYYAQVFDNELKRSKREKHHFNYILLDLDHFKLYNDFYGHQMGDSALQEVSTALKVLLNRPNDFVFRMGGEEFVVLFNSDNEDQAISFGQKIIKAIEELNIEHVNNTPYCKLTISAGLVSCPPSAKQMNENIIYKKADKLLYLAKAKGRNCVKF